MRAPDRDEPRQAIEWSLPLSCRRKNDETKAVDWVARNATRGSGETAREGKGSVRSQERNGWAEKARECRESVSRAEDAKRVRVLAVMERHGLSMPESLEQKRIREIAEKKIALDIPPLHYSLCKTLSSALRHVSPLFCKTIGQTFRPRPLC